MKNLVLLIGLCILALQAFPEEAARPVLPETPVLGFVTHFHEGDYQLLAETPVTAELADLIHWRMTETEEDAIDPLNLPVDFGNAEAWLPLLQAAGRMGFPIIDTAMHHTNISWRHKKTGAVGENHVGFDGKPWTYSSLHSPLFRASVFNYIEQMTGWFRAHDTDGVVPGYLNGAEWFYPGSLDYSSLALDAFRVWLQNRYGALEVVNAAWGSECASWEEVMPPVFSLVGSSHHGAPTFALGGGTDASYASEALPVTPGAWYAISAHITGAEIIAELSVAHIAWLDGAGSMIKLDSVLPEPADDGLYELRAELTAPEDAVSVVFHCKLLMPGTVTYINPRLCDRETGAHLTSAAASDWRHMPFQGESVAEAMVHGDGLHLSLSAALPALPFKHPAAALEDWVLFSHEAMADWLNRCALEIKHHDPGRLVVSYVGFVFAQQAQWDYAMTTQRLDVSLSNSPDIDVNGIQMCIAAEDYTWATHVVDMARKYDKPMWATDLIDFPYGLYSGFEAIYRGSLACVQHGMDGGFWYGWKGVSDYAFSQRMTTADRARLLKDMRLALEAVRGFEPHVAAAQIMPIMSYSIADDGGRKGDMLDNGGLYRLLLDAGVTPDIWTPYEIEQHKDTPLGRYDVVFLSDCPVLPREVFQQLESYVGSGGRLVSSGRLPEKDLQQQPFAVDLSALDGVAALQDRVGRRYWGRVRREQVYGNTPPVLVEAPDPERTPEMRRDLRNRVLKMLEELSVLLPVRLLEDTGNVHVTPFYHPAEERWLLFLVHKGRGRHPRIEMQITLDRPVREAFAWRDFDTHETVPVKDAGVLSIPDFAHACIVELR